MIKDRKKVAKEALQQCPEISDVTEDKEQCRIVIGKQPRFTNISPLQLQQNMQYSKMKRIAHIEQMGEAIKDGVELWGYTPWGCIDQVSASTGEMEKRYGFIYVDKDNKGVGTLERKKKASFDWYKKVIASNGE
jgi:hypothetical protein